MPPPFKSRLSPVQQRKYSKASSSSASDKDSWLRRLLGLGRSALITQQDRETADFLGQLAAEAGVQAPPVSTHPRTSTTGSPPQHPPPAPPGRITTRPNRGGGPSDLPQTRIPRQPPAPGEEDQYGPEIRTPQSSNVYSFSYFRPSGDTTGTLYVTFQEHAINPGSVRQGTTKRGGRRSRTQLRGRLGRTVGGKTGGRGASYAYSRVPPHIYKGMVAAASKGKFVWDKLRIRGSISGHQYAYSLVQGQVSPKAGGVYIPRRATPQGFRTRSVVEVGRGVRGFQTSTLPQTNGFSTRRARTAAGGRK